MNIGIYSWHRHIMNICTNEYTLLEIFDYLKNLKHLLCKIYSNAPIFKYFFLFGMYWREGGRIRKGEEGGGRKRNNKVGGGRRKRGGRRRKKKKEGEGK